MSAGRYMLTMNGKPARIRENGLAYFACGTTYPSQFETLQQVQRAMRRAQVVDSLHGEREGSFRYGYVLLAPSAEEEV